MVDREHFNGKHHTRNIPIELALSLRRPMMFYYRRIYEERSTVFLCKQMVAPNSDQTVPLTLFPYNRIAVHSSLCAHAHCMVTIFPKQHLYIIMTIIPPLDAC